MKKLTLILSILIFLSKNFPLIAQPVVLGDAYIVGQTYFEQQQNSTVGKSISRDESEGTHFVYTRTLSVDNSNRFVAYNFVSDNDGDIADQLAENLVAVDNEQRPGYVAQTLHDFEGQMVSVIFYHRFDGAAYGIDAERGLGAHWPFVLRGPNQMIPLTVKGAVDRDHRIHLVSGLHDMQSATFPVILWNGVMGRDISEWDFDEAIEIDETTSLSHLIAADTESDQVAVAWHHNLAGVPAPDEWEGTAAYGMNNDLYVYISPDGETWDIDEPLNITRTIPPDSDAEGILAYGDTLRPFNDMDMIFVDEILHIVFSTRGFRADPTFEEEPPVESITTNESLIWHWDSETDTLTLVANGWYENDGTGGALHNNVSRPSIGSDGNGNFYCIFRQVTDADKAGGGYCWGEVMLSVSHDDGIIWSEAVNITGSVSAEVAYADEDHPSLAEHVDDYLHIQYLQNYTGNQPSRMIYQRISVEDLPDLDNLELPRDGFTYHIIDPANVQDGLVQLPIGVALSAFPNPFNARLTVNYTLNHEGNVTITLIDLAGRAIAQEDLSETSHGSHSISFDVTDFSAGVYWVRLESGSQTAVTKVVCVK